MKREIIRSDDLATPAGPYSAGVTYGSLIFMSGCVAQDPETGHLVGETIEEQARQALKNLLTVLHAAGGNRGTVLKVNCYLLKMSDFAAFNSVYKEVFGDADFPARTCVAVAELPLGALAEVEGIAYRA
ncbi:RidA family protein (plasmid) [Pantoea vagans]|uniref:RidA family protein n=1 Tax=Pantoea vagans TaxID=470934 RepID=UPI0035117A4D